MDPPPPASAAPADQRCNASGARLPPAPDTVPEPHAAAGLGGRLPLPPEDDCTDGSASVPVVLLTEEDYRAEAKRLQRIRQERGMRQRKHRQGGGSLPCLFEKPTEPDETDLVEIVPSVAARPLHKGGLAAPGWEAVKPWAPCTLGTSTGIVAAAFVQLQQENSQLRLQLRTAQASGGHEQHQCPKCASQPTDPALAPQGKEAERTSLLRALRKAQREAQVEAMERALLKHSVKELSLERQRLEARCTDLESRLQKEQSRVGQLEIQLDVAYATTEGAHGQAIARCHQAESKFEQLRGVVWKLTDVANELQDFLVQQTRDHQDRLHALRSLWQRSTQEVEDIQQKLKMQEEDSAELREHIKAINARDGRQRSRCKVKDGQIKLLVLRARRRARLGRCTNIAGWMAEAVDEEYAVHRVDVAKGESAECTIIVHGDSLEIRWTRSEAPKTLFRKSRQVLFSEASGEEEEGESEGGSLRQRRVRFARSSTCQSGPICVADAEDGELVQESRARLARGRSSVLSGQIIVADDDEDAGAPESGGDRAARLLRARSSVTSGCIVVPEDQDDAAGPLVLGDGAAAGHGGHGEDGPRCSPGLAERDPAATAGGGRRASDADPGRTRSALLPRGRSSASLGAADEYHDSTGPPLLAPEAEAAAPRRSWHHSLRGAPGLPSRLLRRSVGPAAAVDPAAAGRPGLAGRLRRSLRPSVRQAPEEARGEPEASARPLLTPALAAQARSPAQPSRASVAPGTEADKGPDSGKGPESGGRQGSEPRRKSIASIASIRSMLGGSRDSSGERGAAESAASEIISFRDVVMLAFGVGARSWRYRENVPPWQCFAIHTKTGCQEFACADEEAAERLVLTLSRLCSCLSGKPVPGAIHSHSAFLAARGWCKVQWICLFREAPLRRPSAASGEEPHAPLRGLE